MTKRLVPALALALAAAGCTKDPVDAPGTTLKAGRDLGPGLHVVVDSIVTPTSSAVLDSAGNQIGQSDLAPRAYVTIHNGGPEPRSFIPCGEDLVQAELERPDGSGWEAIGGGYCMLASWAGPHTIDAGGTLHAIFRVPAAGRYRIQVPYSERPDFEMSQRVYSEEFEVK